MSISLRSIAQKSALAIAGTTTIGVTSLTIYTNTQDGKGIQRQLSFWSTLSPIIVDYYLQTAKSSPLVQFQKYYSIHIQKSHDETTFEQSRKQTIQSLHNKHAPTVLSSILSLRGLYIKLGQVLSITALPIPEAYRIQFRTLQSSVPDCEDFDTVIKPTIERELNLKSIDELFQYIDTQPCGAASIGQAHIAKFLPHIVTTGDNHNKNEKVILKIQYPDAKWQVPADIKCVGDLLQLCVYFNIVDESAAQISYQDFSKQFLAELDYHQERINLQTIYNSSLDTTSAPYHKRNVVIPRLYDQYCTDKLITMSYLPGPKLEEEAKRQLKAMGIDTNKSLKDILKDAARDASNVSDKEVGELARRVTKRLQDDTINSSNDDQNVVKSSNRIHSQKPKQEHNNTWWRVCLSQKLGNFIGVNTLFWSLRSIRRISLWTQASSVYIIQSLPSMIVPSSIQSWAHDHQTAAEQVKALSMTKEWIDALFDVHGHQIFVLGLFNADPHPGNIILVQNEHDGKNDNITSKKYSPNSKLPKNQLGLIDYGQCKQLTQQEQYKVAQLLLSVANQKSDIEIAAAFRNLGIQTKNDSTEFLAMFAKLLFGKLQPYHLNHDWHKRLHTMDKVIYFPKELGMVHRTSLLLRGLAMSLQLNCSVDEKWKYYAELAVKKGSGNVESD